MTDECKLMSLSTLVCKGVDEEVLTVEGTGVWCWEGKVLLSCVDAGGFCSSSLWLRPLSWLEWEPAVVSKEDAETGSLRAEMLGADDESAFTEGVVDNSADTEACMAGGCVELKPFLDWPSSFCGDEVEEEMGYRRVCVDLCSYKGP